MGAGASVAKYDQPWPKNEISTDSSIFAPTHVEISTKILSLHFVHGSGQAITIDDPSFPLTSGGLSWYCQCTLAEDSQGGGSSTSWNVHVTTVSSTAADGVGDEKKVALLLHGMAGKDRCSAFFANYIAPLTTAGYNVLAIDFPGYGRSGDTTIPTKSGLDAALVRVVLQAFGVQSNVTVIAAGGGCGTFARLYVEEPSLFSGHHVFHNPVLSEHPMLGETMLREGCDLLALLSEGWSKDDFNMSIAICGKFFGGVFETLGPDYVQLCPLRFVGSVSTLKGEMPEDYLMGVRVSKKKVSKEPHFYMLTPSPDCVNDLLGYLSSLRKQKVDTDPAALISNTPTKSALAEGGGKANENFKVFIRVRPMLSREKSESCVRVEDVENFPRTPPPQRISVEDPSLARISRGNYVFDRVFVENASQTEVFDVVAAPLVRSLVEQKKNVTMFAYGQTGTGKTYTMEGPTGIAGMDGLISMSVARMFELSESPTTVQYQYVQLYGGSWLDLLNPSSDASMKVEEVKDGGGKVLSTRIRGATTATANGVDEMLREIQKGATFRSSGATNMNDASSRSHAILIIMLSNNTNMYMIDLAGSERNKRSGASGQRFNEAKSINVALSALGRVVINLVQKDGKRGAHVSYLDNPLTHLLMPGLGGNSKTALISCITAAADSLSESVQTLRFSVQASHVKNRVDAKDAKDQAKKADDKIANAGSHLMLDASGHGEIPVKCGEEESTKLYGFWTNDASSRTIIFIHDFQKNPHECFESLITALKGLSSSSTSAGEGETKGGDGTGGGAMRVLAPTFHYASEKKDGNYNSRAVHVQLLAIMDYLGIAKATLVGDDLGGINALDFQICHKGRTAACVARNKIIDLDVKGWKLATKKDPSFAINCMMNVWNWIVPFDKDRKKSQEKYLKKWKGRLIILWPYAFKGRPDPKGNQSPAYFLKAMCPLLKGVNIIDSYQKSSEELVQVILTASKDGGKKKKSKSKKVGGGK